MKRCPIELPPFAVEYLAGAPAAAWVVRQFHQWLKGTFRSVLQLEVAEVEKFLARLALARSGSTERRHAHDRRRALRYFDWLRDRDLLGFDSRCAWPRSNFPLPPQALRFLERLKPTHKPSTVRQYQTTLRQLHIWLNAERLGIEDLDRARVCSWLGWLHARGLHASTRLHQIQHFRHYLRWLDEEGDTLRPPADELIRPSDLPKLPQYLPRPLPPDIDEELQRRLRRSRSRCQLGLLLMRRTGLRIGELISLAYDCVRVDPHGNTLLKVPLGKLDNERLVPLDDQTAKLVAKLRRQGRRRALLLETATGDRTRYEQYRQALRDACRGLDLAEPMTSHRLRHTYATTLLAGGMSLPGVMKLLGHHDYRMTLRYAAISDETVTTEYAEALKHSEQRYKTLLPANAAATQDPIGILSDLVRYIHKRARDDRLDERQAHALAKRIRRLDTAVHRLLRSGRP